MKGSSSQRAGELYQYKFLPLALQGSKDQVFIEPKEKQISGDIRLGYVYNSDTIFSLLLKELVQHLLIVGRSGSGKTNIIRIIQIELYRLGIPFISFDIAKYGTRYIKHHIKDLIILRWDKEFFFNPLKPPPGVKLKEWLMAFSDITSEVFDIRPASTLFLIKFIQKHLYEKFESEQKSIYPTIHDLNHSLENRRGKKIPRNEIGYINTLKNKIETICIALDQCINVQEGIPIEDLLTHPVSIELVGIKSLQIQTWIMSLIMAWITSYREAHGMSFGKLRHVFFYDEAAMVLGKGDM
jgi:hypothetical protein